MADRSPTPLAPPAGMRDLLPPDAAARRALVSTLLDRLQLHGYELVTTPVFEHASVIERGLPPMDRRDLLRFVEPESGEVAMLRPDITPQIARIVASQLADRPPPWRLSYAGSLIRQRRERAHRPRRLFQVGGEHVGPGGPEADAETIGVAVDALLRAGLASFSLELHLPGLARGLLAKLPEAAATEAVEALARKDRDELAGVLKRAGVARAQRNRILELPSLYGGPEVLTAAAKVFDVGGKDPLLGRLRAVCRRLVRDGLEDRLIVDLGEVRDAAYYTGISFAVLAAGPGEPVGAGGRYDRLLGRFDAPAPAIGFALDVGNLEWALRTAGRGAVEARAPRVVIVGAQARRDAAARALREIGVTAATLDGRGLKQALAYGAAWDYDAALRVARDRWSARHLRDGRSWQGDEAAGAAQRLRRWVESKPGAKERAG